MLRSQDIVRLNYVFSIAGNILTTKNLVEEGISPTITELLLPSLLLSFGPKLIANTIYTRYHLTAESIILYAVGFVLSVFLYSNSFVMFLLREVPHVSKFFSLVDLKNSKENTFLLLSWNITSNLAQICLKSFVFKKKLKIKIEELLNMVFVYGGIVFLRHYHLHDYYVIVVANIIPIMYKAIEAIVKAKNKKAEGKAENVAEEEKPAKKRVKRKASVSAKKNK